VVYDPKSKKRSRKASCAAIIVQVYRETRASDNAKIELYSKTYRREGGVEYDLREPLKETIDHAMKKLGVKPKSLVMWRDGIGETAFESKASEEILGIREGLAGLGPVGAGKKKSRVPVAYVVCQKRIATKFLVQDNNEVYGAPSGTMVEDLQGMQHQTFYINGRAPPYSTAKPVRYIIVENDSELMNVSMSQLTWGACHDYPNVSEALDKGHDQYYLLLSSCVLLTWNYCLHFCQWTGPVKVPSVCQMAHKLAELAGQMSDCGESINADAYANSVYFL